MAQKKWEEMSPKEKMYGLIGLGIIILIVFGVISSVTGIGQTKDNKATTKDDGASSLSVTNTPQATEANPADPVTPKVYTGTGDDVVHIVKPTDGAAILSFECLNCAGNTSVQTNGYESLIVNTIGAYTGDHIIDVTENSFTSKVTITADAAWKLTVSGLDKATLVNAKKVSGKGDTVLYIAGDTSEATFTNDGDENFSVEAYPYNGGSENLAVNTIGGYRGIVPLDSQSYVQISSNGNWSIATE